MNENRNKTCIVSLIQGSYLKRWKLIENICKHYSVKVNVIYDIFRHFPNVMRTNCKNLFWKNRFKTEHSPWLLWR